MDDSHPEVTRLRPLARLGKDEWATLGEVLERPRIRYADWEGGAGGARAEWFVGRGPRCGDRLRRRLDSGA